MTYNPEIHHRRSIRLKGYDYSQTGAYFVTVCVKDHACLFGTIMDGKLQYNDYGQIAYEFWLKIPEHFSDAKLDEFIIMPNHIHGIITINCRGEVSSPSSPDSDTIKSTQMGGATPPLRKITLGQIVAYFKYQSSKRINQTRNTSGQPVWQRNYYEHIIRDEKELNQIREYIVNNPMQWELDTENPQNIKGSKLKNA